MEAVIVEVKVVELKAVAVAEAGTAVSCEAGNLSVWCRGLLRRRRFQGPVYISSQRK